MGNPMGLRVTGSSSLMVKIPMDNLMCMGCPVCMGRRAITGRQTRSNQMHGMHTGRKAHTDVRGRRRSPAACQTFSDRRIGVAAP